jgi:hypothetical protein
LIEAGIAPGHDSTHVLEIRLSSFPAGALVAGTLEAHCRGSGWIRYRPGTRGTPPVSPAAVQSPAKVTGRDTAIETGDKPLPPHHTAAVRVTAALELARRDEAAPWRRLGNTKDPKERAELIRRLFAHLADRLPPKDAILWAMSFEGTDQDTALKELAAVWMGAGPEAITGGGVLGASAVLQAGLALRIYEATPRGIGTVLAVTDGFPVIRSVLPESAAARAGLQAGDRFLEVTGPDGKTVPLYQQPIENAVRSLQGESGETIAVRILRDGAGGAPTEHVIRVTRDQIIFPPATANVEQK